MRSAVKRFFVYCHESVDESTDDLILAVNAGHGNGACHEIPMPAGISELPTSTLWYLGLGVLFQNDWSPPMLAVIVQVDNITAHGVYDGESTVNDSVVIVHNLAIDPIAKSLSIHEDPMVSLT
jgi:hypothetical protein